jgi:hypothetical protein
MSFERLPIFFKLSQRNTSLKGQVDPVPDAYVITLYTKNIESPEDLEQTIAHEILHIIHPDWDEEKVESESKVLAESEAFRRWVWQKAKECQLLLELFQTLMKSQSIQ